MLKKTKVLNVGHRSADFTHSSPEILLFKTNKKKQIIFFPTSLWASCPAAAST